MLFFKRQTKIKQLLILILFLFLAPIACLIFKLNALSSVIVFLVAPSVYLSFLLKENIKKSLIFSAVTSIPFIIVIDYIANVTKQWVEPQTIFPFRFLGIISVEVILWTFFLTYFMIMFYEIFFDNRKDDKIIFSQRTKFLATISLTVLLVFFLIYFFTPQILYISYFYLKFGIILIFIPLFIEMFRRPKLAGKALGIGAYFFFLSFLYEITALKLGYWYFPGSQFIGMITIFGVAFPFEELFFYILLLPMACICYYEFFAGDEK